MTVLPYRRRLMMLLDATAETAKDAPHPLTPEERSEIAKRAWVTRGSNKDDPDSVGTLLPSSQKYERPKAIRVKTTKEAVPLILQGKVVELSSPRKVNTLLLKLAAIAKDAMLKGGRAPNYDLCNITVKGASFFCESIVRTDKFPGGIDRIEMPQFTGKPKEGSPAAALPRDARGEVNAGKQFTDHLLSLGIASEEDDVPAAKLIASQKELIGPKVAGSVGGKDYDPGTIYISRDNYIIDGHHRWAAQVARDAADNRLGQLPIHVIRVDAPITEVLFLARKFTREYGLPVAGGVKHASAQWNSYRWRLALAGLSA